MTRQPALVFRGLRPDLPVTIYRRDLPHWRQTGATYFVTFRLADSIPDSVLRQWREERRVWLQAHGLDDGLREQEWAQRYQGISMAERRSFERTQAHRLLAETDKGHGACLLAEPEIATCVGKALQFFHGNRCGCGDFVVMPNHVHWVVQPLEGFDLENILASVKRFVSTEATKLGVKSGTFWQRESYDHLIRDRPELSRIRVYIAENPAQARVTEGRFLLHRAGWLDGEVSPVARVSDPHGENGAPVRYRRHAGCGAGI